MLKNKSLEDYDSFLKISEHITEYVQELLYNEEFDLVQTSDIDPIDVFKAVSIEIDGSINTIPEKFLEYISISEKFMDTKLFVLINFREFFSDEEAIQIYNKFLLNKTKFLVVQSKSIKAIDYREFQYIIDDDYCEI